jgi:hypothetical protein
MLCHSHPTHTLSHQLNFTPNVGASHHMQCNLHPAHTCSHQLNYTSHPMSVLHTTCYIVHTRHTHSHQLHFTPNISASHHMLCHLHLTRTHSHQLQFTPNVSGGPMHIGAARRRYAPLVNLGTVARMLPATVQDVRHELKSMVCTLMADFRAVRGGIGLRRLVPSPGWYPWFRQRSRRVIAKSTFAPWANIPQQG